MIRFELNGKPFNPETLEESLLKQAMEKMGEVLRDRIGSIRLPLTGEFPTIIVSGTSLGDLKARVEGSPELLAIVNERLQLSDDRREITKKVEPRVFLSYAWEDRQLASLVADKLQANGIDTWWAHWCLSAGDSLRQKIDEGLSDCSHFVVLLTPNSISKPWVNQEMDAGLILKLRSQVTFIPLRHRLSAEQLPPLLRGLLSPVIEDPDEDIVQLINDIHGVTKKPQLGQAPVATSARLSSESGYSAAAVAVAKVFVESTAHARKFDPQLSIQELIKRTGLSSDDLADAIYELGHLIVSRHDIVWPNDDLFVVFDRLWKPWNPSEDALRLAIDMMNHEDFPTAPAEIGGRYEWQPRRLNPAMAYLINRDLVRDLKAMDGSNWLAIRIQKTDATRRFVKSRS